VQNEKCSSDGSNTPQGTQTYTGSTEELFWSANNVIYGSGAPFEIDASCEDGTWSSSGATAVTDDPSLTLMPYDADTDTPFMDPRPASTSSILLTGTVDSVPDNGFFVQTSYKGAFDVATTDATDSFWLAESSWLSENGRIPSTAASGTVVAGGEITASTTWSLADSPYLLTGQVFVGGGATLTIEAGVTIYGYKDDGTGAAPCLVIESGSMIEAVGTSSAPITFTSAMPSSFLPASGMWGGLIIMGDATVYGGTDEVEGITGYTYGGTNDADNSGTLSYVRVWYGGAVIGANNEINGITFAGVGSGTTVDHCEVAFNLDDGFEFFGGTVNAKYLSVLFAGDDALDTDLGYSGSIQFAYVMVGSGGNHGTEMDSKYDATPRSYPSVYSSTFIGHLNHAVTSSSTDETSASIIHLREGTAGAFGNILV
jgi:hypothetical protein